MLFCHSISVYDCSCTTQIKFCTNFKNICIFVLVEKIETNIHLEQPFYLLTNTWEYSDGVFGTEVARGD